MRLDSQYLTRPLKAVKALGSFLIVIYLRLKGVRCEKESIVSRHAKISLIGGGAIAIGKRCEIHDYSMLLSYGGKIVIGDDCSINPFCILYGHGGLVIGNGVRIASHSIFIPANHVFQDNTRPVFEQGETRKGIIVEDDVWIGSRVTVLDGVRISHGCVIGAGAVLTKSTERYGIYAGVPAKKIGSRYPLEFPIMAQ